MMILSISLVLFYLLMPVLLIYLVHISKTINKIGAVVMAYILGLIAGNIGIFPRASDSLKAILGGKSFLPHDQLTNYLAEGKILQSDMTVNQIASIQDMIMSVAIPIALPLLLFSLDIKRWLKLAKEGLLSLVLGVSSLIIVVVAGYFLFKNYIDESWKVAGMLIGVYTGGTPNLAAIGTALDVPPNIFILTNTYDMVLGSICLFFLLTAAQRIFNMILPHFRESHEKVKLKKIIEESSGIDNYLGMLTRRGLFQLSKALGLSVLILGTSFGISLLMPKSSQTAVIILLITTLGLLLGTIKSISKIEKTFQLGMYFIIVFSMVVASMADLRSMFQIDFLHLFMYISLVVFGSIIVHVFLSYLFKIDSDTTIITIAALTFSPPFVPVVAAALKNKEIIITGITTGIMGYAFGNYLGVGLAYFLKAF
ncbi:MAG: hypothetical protein A2066_06810 [Bacteroidetes bacterium GWB2_41_8]|nr:MAG: hypothetical protein A2066_06810 [Bacteroidetes bacterium GWB2_41_8]